MEVRGGEGMGGGKGRRGKHMSPPPPPPPSCFGCSCRVLNVLRHWVEFHYYDFERHPKLLLKLSSFVGSVKSKSMQKWVVSINRSLQKKDTQPSVFKHVFNSKAEPVEWHIAKKNEEYHLLTVCC